MRIDAVDSIDERVVAGPLASQRVSPSTIRLSADTRWQPASQPIDDRHTVGLGADDRLWITHGKYGLDWARDSKALNHYQGRRRSMEQAKRDWGLLVDAPLPQSTSIAIGVAKI